MRLLVLSFYYPPDLSAGSFRSVSIVNALSRSVPRDTKIDVVTTIPNRYRTYDQTAPEVEHIDNVSIRRIALPAHRSDFFGQSRSFVRFARAAIREVSGRRYDIVFATSSRLMTAALGAWIARRQHSTLYLDIRDIFADTIRDILPGALAWPTGAVFSALERWTMHRADRINLVSRGFEGYFRQRYPDRSFSWYTNGIDDEFMHLSAICKSGVESADCKTVLYAGNIGDGQGLHRIVPQLAGALRGQARFVIVGDGGRRKNLETAVSNQELNNVEIRPPVSRETLRDLYCEADVLFLHLGALKAFEKVLPSKLFEYAATGKPILAGVAGYPAQFVRSEIANAAVFPPCDTSAAASAFNSLDFALTDRGKFVQSYARSNIARQMAEDIRTLTRSS